jgi:hypothetical protein
VIRCNDTLSDHFAVKRCKLVLECQAISRRVTPTSIESLGVRCLRRSSARYITTCGNHSFKMLRRVYFGVAYYGAYLAIALGAPLLVALVPLVGFHAERHGLVVQVGVGGCKGRSGLEFNKDLIRYCKPPFTILS